MKFVQKEFIFEMEEKKSKFITYLFPYNIFKESLKIIQQEHQKAVHFVYAYRYLNEYNQIIENSSDDGEPKGTSGKPTLAVLSGAGIINSAIVTVRYFGGTKLGTGGLIRAYSFSANGVIKISEFIEYKKLIYKNLSTNYSNVSKLEYILNQQNIKIISKNFDEEVIIKIELCDEEFVILQSLLSRHIRVL